MKDLLIVFIKNPELGKVKTRLASEIGDDEALKVYLKLLNKTLNVAENGQADCWVYFSEKLDPEIWPADRSRIQEGPDLGSKMKNAFAEGFNSGYDRICLIGSDLPSISTTLIDSAFKSLSFMDTVIGPAKDGGYYLIGLKRIIPSIFQHIAWSTNTVLETTLKRLTKEKESYFLLETLNDIDTLEDLISSGLNAPI